MTNDLMTAVSHTRDSPLCATPVLTLKAAKQIAEEEGICHVYLGNVSL